jgi:2-polyprenyl-3-methyl-5-hydroxy-6-metoxy-1,4-benzoquinol methylase
MSGCCGPNGCAEMFGERFVRKAVRRYRRRGLDGNSRWFVERLGVLGLSGASVLDIGGGIGAISLQLLRAGARTAVVVELSPAYEHAAAELAREEGVAERTGFVLGDLAADPALAQPADMVALHRVVCCSPHGPELLAAAAERARHGLVFSYPTRAWWLRLGTWLLNRGFAAVGREYRMYLHEHASLLAAVEGAGLRPVASRKRLVWRLAAFERV